MDWPQLKMDSRRLWRSKATLCARRQTVGANWYSLEKQVSILAIPLKKSLSFEPISIHKEEPHERFDLIHWAGVLDGDPALTSYYRSFDSATEFQFLSKMRENFNFEFPSFLNHRLRTEKASEPNVLFKNSFNYPKASCLEEFSRSIPLAFLEAIHFGSSEVSLKFSVWRRALGRRNGVQESVEEGAFHFG